MKAKRIAKGLGVLTTLTILIIKSDKMVVKRVEKEPQRKIALVLAHTFWQVMAILCCHYYVEKE